MRLSELSGKEIVDVKQAARLGVLGQTDLEINESTDRLVILPLAIFRSPNPASSNHPAITGQSPRRKMPPRVEKRSVDNLLAKRGFSTPDLPSNTPPAKIPDFVAIHGPCLVLVSRFGPAAGALLEIAGPFAQPLELVAVAAHHHQRVAQVDGMVGAEAELAAWF